MTCTAGQACQLRHPSPPPPQPSATHTHATHAHTCHAHLSPPRTRTCLSSPILSDSVSMCRSLARSRDSMSMPPARVVLVLVLPAALRSLLVVSE